MTQAMPQSRIIPAVVEAFATRRVMHGLRPSTRGSGAHRTAQAIGTLMRAVAERDGQRTGT